MKIVDKPIADYPDSDPFNPFPDPVAIPITDVFDLQRTIPAMRDATK